MAFRKALPLRQRLPYQGQRRRPPPAAETGSRCWGRGQQDASDSAADAGSRNPALSNEVRLRGWTKDSLTASLCWAQPLRHRLRDATSPTEGRPWHSAKLCLLAKGSPTRGNGDDRRQRRKQGVAVGAAASRMQATAQQTLGAATRPCLRSETERLDEGWPDREPLTFGHSETGDAVCLYIICPMTAA